MPVRAARLETAAGLDEPAPLMPDLAARAPKQSRSRASFEKVLAAATAILAESGYDGLTLNDVSRRSGVSIGSIYGRVTGKDELVQIVQRQVLELMAAEQDRMLAPARWAGLPLDRLTPALVDELAEFLRRWSPLLRAFMLRAGQDEVVSAAGRASAVQSAARAEALLLLCRPEIRRRDPERAAAACYTTIYAVFSRYLGLGLSLEAAGGGDWAELKEDVAAMCLCYLQSAEAD